MIDVIKSFESKYIPEPNSGCWLWLAGCIPKGYAIFWNGSKQVLAHRFSYETFVATIPKALVLDHLCRVTCCVNPKHLEPVTQRENVRRGNAGNICRNKTHCPKGHKYSADNIYWSKHGRRTCKTCTTVSNKARYEATRKLR